MIEWKGGRVRAGLVGGRGRDLGRDLGRSHDRGDDQGSPTSHAK